MVRGNDSATMLKIGPSPFSEDEDEMNNMVHGDVSLVTLVIKITQQQRQHNTHNFVFYNSTFIKYKNDMLFF